MMQVSNRDDAIQYAIAAMIDLAFGPVMIPDLTDALRHIRSDIDTYDVRDAVWKLIGKDVLEFTPRCYVKRKS